VINDSVLYKGFELSVSNRLRKNLKALKRVDPELAGRVALPVASDHIPEHQGKTYLRVHRTLHPLGLTADQRTAACSDTIDAEDVLVFGIGTGDLVDSALLGRKGKVVVWDRDPWLLRKLLDRKDYRRAIDHGKLVLKLGASLVAECESLRSLPRIDHPLLAQVYKNEHLLLRDGISEKRALICAGTLFVDDLAEALRAEGYSVYSWDLNRLAKEELVWGALQVKPNLVAAINYSYGLAEMCTALGCPLFVWEIDPSTDLLQPLARRADNAHVFTWRKAHVELFQKGGFGHAEHLPLATNPARRRPIALTAEERAHYTAPVTFIGASMLDQANRFQELFLRAYADFKGSEPAHRTEGQALLNAVLTAQRKDFSRYLVPTLAQRAFPEFLEALSNKPQATDPFMLVGEIAAAEKRLSYVAALGQQGVEVWGDDGWKAIERFGVKHRGAAGHNKDVTALYNTSSIHLDIGRIYQSDIITMRVFDVLACGGFVLAEHSNDLAECFEIGTEVDCYRNQEEMVAKVAHYLAHPDEAAAIAKRGQARVLADHTIQARVSHMLGRLT